jgi:excisionase family DNA binding protein
MIEKLKGSKRPGTATPPAGFDVEDAAAYLGLGATKFRELLRNETIRHRKVGRRLVIARAELDRFLGMA